MEYWIVWSQYWVIWSLQTISVWNGSEDTLWRASCSRRPAGVGVRTRSEWRGSVFWKSDSVKYFVNCLVTSHHIICVACSLFLDGDNKLFDFSKNSMYSLFFLDYIFFSLHDFLPRIWKYQDQSIKYRKKNQNSLK